MCIRDRGKSRYRIHAYYSANDWFQEDFGPSLNIAPEDAEARGIVTGDDVRVFNDRGSFVATALVNRSLDVYKKQGSSCPGGGRRGAVARCSWAGTRRLGFLGGNAYRCGRVGIGGLRIERCVLSAVLGRPCARWPCCSFCDRGCPRALQCE